MLTPFRSAAAFALLLALVGASPGAAADLDVSRTKAAVDEQLNRDYPRLEALYKAIHSHPELGFEEHATASRLAKEMREIGFQVTEGVGKTGVVAILHNGPGPTVLVRTELDALPMEEKTGLPYASHVRQTWNGKETFVAHSCGHDVHMAAWVGTARALTALKGQWRGTLMFVAQPAEELTGGAAAMLADGLFTRFGKPDYGFALHVGPFPAGDIVYRPGLVSSTSDALQVTFHGVGAHGSMPNASIDPVMMGARFVVDVQSVISRERDPDAFGVVTIGAFQSGSAGNIIPDVAVLSGTIRTYDDGVRARILDGVRRTAQGVAAMAGAPAPAVEITEGGKAVYNDEALTSRTGAVLRAAFGQRVTLLSRPGAASEDYSEFVRAGVPSVFFGVGGLDPQVIADAKASHQPVPVNHSPYFAPVPEPTIRTAVAAMSLAVLNVLPASPAASPPVSPQ